VALDAACAVRIKDRTLIERERRYAGREVPVGFGFFTLARAFDHPKLNARASARMRVWDLTSGRRHDKVTAVADAVCGSAH
jgi:hypothetical protein